MSYPLLSDISNYDFDEDADRPTWVQEFIDTGVAGIIVGSQWPSKAHHQLEMAKAGGLFIAGTYAEPDVSSAIALAQEFGANRVGLACERGSILSRAELYADIVQVKDAGLTPWIYGNAGDLIAIAGQDLLYAYDVWLASYGFNDPFHPLPPITGFDFGRGHRALIAHQFGSTTVVAGRNRDLSYWFGQEEDIGLTENEQILIDVAWGDYERMATCYDVLVGKGILQHEDPAQPPPPPGQDTSDTAIVKRGRIMTLLHGKTDAAVKVLR